MGGTMGGTVGGTMGGSHYINFIYIYIYTYNSFISENCFSSCSMSSRQRYFLFSVSPSSSKKNYNGLTVNALHPIIKPPAAVNIEYIAPTHVTSLINQIDDSIVNSNA